MHMPLCACVWLWVCVRVCGLVWWFLEAGYSSCLWFLSFSPLLLPVHWGLQPFDNTHFSHITNKGSITGLTNEMMARVHTCMQADRHTKRLITLTGVIISIFIIIHFPGGWFYLVGRMTIGTRWVMKRGRVDRQKKREREGGKERWRNKYCKREWEWGRKGDETSSPLSPMATEWVEGCVCPSDPLNPQFTAESCSTTIAVVTPNAQSFII